MRRWVFAVAGLVLVVVLVGIPLYVAPASDDPAVLSVDAVYVIGPPTDARMETALDMIEAGQARALLVSLDPAEAPQWPKAAQACGLGDEGVAAGSAAPAHAPDSSNITALSNITAPSDSAAPSNITALSNIATPPDVTAHSKFTAPSSITALPDITVLCAKPDPFTTRGEARWLEQQMHDQGWDSAAVVTFTPHISRARMIMDRCDTGGVAMVDVGEPLAPWFWAYHFGYQTAGFAKAFALSGC